METIKLTEDIGKYIVHSDGRIWSKIHKKFLKPHKESKSGGYLRVTLRVLDSSNILIHGKYYKVHQLVAICFIPNVENKPEINHIDNNPENNHYKNLEWVTRSEQMKHAFRKGNASNKGIKNPKNKLTEKQVQEIRNLRKITTMTYKEIGNLYGLDGSRCWDVVNRNWSHLK